MKKALIVGINYVGTGNDLRGCINDANNMKALLESRGFVVTMLLEEQATTANMIAAMNTLVKGAVDGDVVVFHYSGHGSQLPSKSEADGFEEIICPIDLDWRTKVISDETLRSIFGQTARGVNTTVILDCCHSGTALNQDESLDGDDAIVVTKDVQLEGLNDAREGGEDGDRYLQPPQAVLDALEDRELVDWSTQRDINANAMLIAGCRANQTSADAFIDGKAQGAATAALIKSVTAMPNITYLGLVTQMNEFMRTKKFAQRPQLDGFKGLREEAFLEPWGSNAEPLVIHGPEPTAPVIMPPVNLPPTVPVTTTTNNNGSTLVVIVLAVLAVLAFVLMH